MLSLTETAIEVAPFVGDSGACPDEPRVKEAINRARRVLYELGNWDGTVSDIVIQSYKGTITLPPAYDFITKSWRVVRKMDLPNEWFTIVTHGFRDVCSLTCPAIKMNEPVVTFRDFAMIYPDNCFFRAEVMFESDREEEGTEVVLHGYNKQGGRQALSRKYKTGFKGITETPVIDQYVRSLYQVTKPQTVGRVRVYGYQPSSEKEVLMAIYEKDDINPTLTRYSVGTCSINQYAISAKKKYRPLVNDSDPVEIHPDALVHAIQALTARGNRNLGEYNSNLSMAVQFLDRQLGKDDTFRQSYMRIEPSQNTNLNY